MPIEHLFVDIYSALLCVSFLLSIVGLRLSTFNKPISDLIRLNQMMVMILLIQLKPKHQGGRSLG